MSPLLAAGMLFVLLVPVPAAADRPLWTIGRFDGASGEFRGDDVPAGDPVFVVGKSQDEDWYRFQPGPANGLRGGRLHPFKLAFTLPDVPRGVYHLKVGILYETPRLSFLQLAVNGHSGSFYFHPKLDYRAGDWEGTFVPQTSVDTKSIEIPARWLRQGHNEFVLTAMDDPSTPQNSLGAIAPGCSGLVYDALQLTAGAHSEFEARVEPTIFYRDGRELVDVFTCSSQPGVFTLNHQDYPLPAADFGERRGEFAVPEWTGTVTAVIRMADRTVSIPVTPARKWTIAIVPHEHLDVGFTDYPAKVAELHSQSIDEAMHLVDATPDFRWTLDGSWVADQYLKGRSPQAQDRFLAHVRAGTVVIPPQLSNQHTGNASWEGLVRSLYDERRIERQYGLAHTDTAHIVDVPSYAWGYASILHAAGIKYFLAASNSWRAPIMLLGRWNEKSPFYWEGPDGSRVLMWYARAYLQMHTLFGSPWQLESIRDSLPVFLQAYTRPDYTAHTAIIFGTQLENTPLAREQSEVVSAFSRQYQWPHLQFSTVHGAMQQIESEWQGALPVYRGDFGPYWEDGYGSDAVHTAVHRSNQHRLLTAEILGSAASALDADVRPDAALLQDAWRNELVYDEHTWSYAGATTQPEHHQSEDQLGLKRARVVRAQHDIDESIQRGWAQLEAQVKPAQNAIAVFNPLNWSRSGLIDTDLPAHTQLIDASTGQTVPMTVLRQGKGIALPGFGDGYCRIRFEAHVPAVGYKLYTLKTGAPTPAVPVPGNVLDNMYYRVTLDARTGSIASIVDKSIGRELVDQKSPYRFGQYLYVTGGDDYPRNSLYRFVAGLRPPVLRVHPASGRLLRIVDTPYGQTARIESPDVRTDVVLFKHEKKITLEVRVHKGRVLSREAAYIAFPFAVDAPSFAYGAQAAWVDPQHNELPGGCREWYLPTTWAAVHNPQLSAAVVPVDAPLVTFGDIVRGRWPTEFKPRSSTIFSWVMNNYWGTNFPAWQGGDFTFRYVITSSGRFDPPGLTRFGLNALTPMERDDVAGSSAHSVLPVTQASLLSVDNPTVNLLTWKQAEDGDGTILRLQETAGHATSVQVSSPWLTVDQAWLCSALEDNESEVDPMNVPLTPFQVVTVRIREEKVTWGSSC